jgi:hypothetical protein
MKHEKRLRAAEEAAAAWDREDAADPVRQAIDATLAVTPRLEALAVPGDADAAVEAVCKLLTANIESPAGRPSYPAALVGLLEATPPDLRATVIADLAAARDSAGRYGRHTLEDWLRNLSLGRSRLPAGLTGDVMRHLLGVYLDRGTEVDQSSMTCDGCGLERPIQKQPPWPEWKLLPGKTHDSPPPRYDLPEFFRACPHCGGAEWTWTHLRDDAPDPGIGGHRPPPDGPGR